MKKFWKALGIAAIAAVIVPVKFDKDETTGKKKYQSLLMSLDIGPGNGEDKVAIGLNFGEGILNDAIVNAATKREGILFADDEPEAAVVDTAATEAPAPAEADEVPQTEETADPVATEEDFDPDL